MSLIFVGGARGTGKSTLLKIMKASLPHIEHIILSREVTRVAFREASQDDYVGVRRLTPEQQRAVVSEVIEGVTEDIQENPAKIVFVDGHYVSSSYIDNHETFFPFLGENVRWFDKMFWIKTEPEEITHRRMIRDHIARPLDLTKREYLAEGIEAGFLERKYGTDLITCQDYEFCKVVYNHIYFHDLYGHQSQANQQSVPKQVSMMKRQAERGDSSLPLKVQALLRLLHDGQLSALSRELDATPALLSERCQRPIAGRSEGLEAAA